MSETPVMLPGVDDAAIVSLGHAIRAFSESLNGVNTRETVRKAIHSLGIAMESLPQQECPLKHYYADGLYGRRWHCTAPALIVTEIHKVQHISMLLKGKIAVATTDGCQVMTAPEMMVTEAGTQRVILVLEDCEFATVHLNPDNQKDPDELKKTLTVRNYDDFAPMGELL